MQFNWAKKYRQIRKLVTGSAEKPYKDVRTVDIYADRIMDILYKNKILPQNIGIDGHAKKLLS